MILNHCANGALALISTLGVDARESLPGPGSDAGPLSVPSAVEARAALAIEEPAWRFDAFIYVWVAGVSGHLTVDDEDVDLGGSNGDGDGFSADPDLSGFMGHFEAHHGPWSFALAPIFVGIEAVGDQPGAVDAEVTIHAQVHEAFVAHDIGSSWEWLAGARYCMLDTDVDLSVGGVPAGSEGDGTSWVDPIVGARFHHDFSEDWSVNARADVGGFGVGSDFAWNASAHFGYRFSAGFAAHAGYRALGVDFQDGSGNDRVAYDLLMQGPLIGVSFSF